MVRLLTLHREHGPLLGAMNTAYKQWKGGAYLGTWLLRDPFQVLARLITSTQSVPAGFPRPHDVTIHRVSW